MAAFDNETALTKAKVKFLSAFCGSWCIILGGSTFFMLSFKLPFDFIKYPLLAVKVLSGMNVIVHLGLKIVTILSSARTSFYMKPKQVFKCFMGIAVACSVFHVIAILFGAPALKSSRETFHFALLLTCLTVVPTCFVLGSDSERWTTVFLLHRPALGKEVLVYITTVSTLVGAWLGAVPIPLDWDRPWQVWPISCVLGAIFGHCLGLLIAAVYVPMQIRQLNKSKLT